MSHMSQTCGCDQLLGVWCPQHASTCLAPGFGVPNALPSPEQQLESMQRALTQASREIRSLEKRIAERDATIIALLDALESIRTESHSALASLPSTRKAP
jgi:septal ring factor EnvC (AmiA/AmiB activator)